MWENFHTRNKENNGWKTSFAVRTKKIHSMLVAVGILFAASSMIGIGDMSWNLEILVILLRQPENR